MWTTVTDIQGYITSIVKDYISSYSKQFTYVLDFQIMARGPSQAILARGCHIHT